VVGTAHDHPVPPGPWRDVRLDVTSSLKVNEAITRERPNAVIYTSYKLGHTGITVDGALHAARAASKVGARFVLMSTDMVFGGETGNYDESARAAPVLPYGAHKLEAEGQVWIEHEEAVILRAALMVGESGRHQRPAFECGLLARGEPAPLFVDEWRSPIHVDDVARAVWDLVSLDVKGLFHLGGPQRLTRMELGRALCAGYGFDAALLRDAKRPADRPRDVSLDSRRLAGLLGWSPRAIGDMFPAVAAA